MNTKLNEFIESIRKEFGAGELSLTRPDLNGVYQKHGNSIGLKLFTTNPDFRVKHGLYRVPATNKSVEVASSAASTEMVLAMKSVVPVVDKAMIPTPDPSFVPFGDFRLILNFVKSNMLDRKSTRLNSSHMSESRMPSSA